MNIDRRELLRYLGWKGQTIDTDTQKIIEETCDICLGTARPKHVARLFGYEDGRLSGTGFVAEGNDIRRHLEGCDRVILFAATLGAETDRMTEKLFASSSQRAVIFDSAASCAIESYCDEACEALQTKYGPLTPRFSCGYGDFPLSAQRRICALLRSDTTIGLCVDAGGSLVPRKSVTALIGIKKDGKPFPFSKAAKCAACTAKNCNARDNGAK